MGLDSLRPAHCENKEFSGTFQRKLEKKLHFYAKVRDAVVSLGAKKAINKKKRLRNRQRKAKAYDLSGLAEFLPELNATPKPPHPATNTKLNCKSRPKLVERESKQLAMVLNHPEFQLDPLAAIHRHLETTLAREIGSEAKLSAKKDQKKDAAKRKQNKYTVKKKKSNASVAPQSMKF